MTAYEGTVEEGVVWQADSSSSGWSLSVDGGDAEQVEPSSVEGLPPSFAGGNVYQVSGGDEGELRYGTPLWRLGLSGAQVALWVLAIVVVRRTRLRRGGNGNGNGSANGVAA